MCPSERNGTDPVRPVAPREDAEALAQRFHEAYERLAPTFGYQTNWQTAKPWPDVPERNRRLMIAVCAELLAAAPVPCAASPADQKAPHVSHGCTPSNLAGAPPFFNYCSLEREWPADGAAKQFDYKCPVCNERIVVNVDQWRAPAPTGEGVRDEQAPEVLPVPPTDDSVRREAAPLRSKPCPACGAEAFEDGRHQRDDTPPPYCALCGSGAPPVAVALEPHRLPAACLDCGLDYEHFPLDVVLPDAQWRAINPDDGGVLCASCIAKRAAQLSDTIIVFAQIISRDDHDAYSTLKNVPIAELARLRGAASAIQARVQQDEVLLAKEPDRCPCRYCTHLRHRLEAFREALAALCPTQDRP